MVARESQGLWLLPGRKSSAITCAKRLSEFLADDRLKDKGLTCKYIVSQFPQGKSTTDRIIPIQIFQMSPAVAQKYLGEWCGHQNLGKDQIIVG